MRQLLLAAAIVLTLTAYAQNAPTPPLALRELTVRPLWREVGKTYDLQVRFITNAPAVAAGELSGVSTAGPEKYACNNHRLDFPGVAVGPAHTLRFTLTGLNQTRLEQTVEVPSPTAPPTVPAGKVPLTVTEPCGQDRVQTPLTFGVPLAKGSLFEATNTRLLTPSGPLPLQARSQTRWEDGSIKWLLIDTQLDLQANQKLTLVLEYGGTAQSPAPTTALKLSAPDEKGILIDTGTSTFLLTKLGLFAAGAKLTSTLTAADGKRYPLSFDLLSVQEQGPLRSILRATGHYRDDTGKQHFLGELLVTVFAGKSYLRVDHVFGNDRVDVDMTPIKALALDFAPLAANSPAVQTHATIGVEGAEALPLPAGATVVQQFDDKFTGAATGKRLAGWLKTDTLSLAAKDFWRQYPKSLSASAAGLQLGLCPEIAPADLYANKPDEEKLYYYLRDGNYTFRRGLMKRHELWLGAPQDCAEITARAARPLTAVASARYYQQVKAAGDILAESGKGWAHYDRIMADGLTAYIEGRERDREYGLMNWGDWFGERGLNWGNIEYDLPVGMLQQYLRSGDPRYFFIAEVASRHNTEIDTIHWAQEPTRLPDRSVEPVPGEIWVHSMGHTGGYYPKDYKGMEVYGPGYATNRGHMWVGGNVLYALLSGDPLALSSTLLSADWMAGPNTTNFDYGNAREPGWMGMAVMSAYRATRDPYYLNAADIMFTKVHEKAQATRPEYGLYYHELPPGHCDCPKGEKHSGEAGFMAGVLMSSMKRFYEETGREQVAKDIEGISKLIVDTMWSPLDNSFRYTSCPRTTISASSGGIIDEGLAFTANRTHNEQLQQIVRLSFAQAMIGLESSGASGKSAGYLIHSMPGAIYEIGKFPGEEFDTYYARQQQEAKSPALTTLPTLMPNPDFEEGVTGWNTRTGFTAIPAAEAAHSGTLGALVTGTGKGQNEYLVTKYQCGPPWEIMSLEPGKKYRLSAWVKVLEITPGTPPPSLRCAMRDKAQTREAFTTNTYDDKQPGTWQRLSCEFTAPAYVNSAYVAVNMNTRETVTIRLAVDDVNLTAAESADLPTYSYPTATAEQAKLGAGLKLTGTTSGPPWKFMVLAGKGAGAATVSLNVTEAGEYRLWLRARENSGPALTITCDGKPAGSVSSAETPWQWLPALSGGKPVVLSLQPGAHTLKLSWPAGCKLGVQKLVLSNDLSSR